ncbi:unnamed protein product [Brachionus calyciflorus]|uniref:Uncharacterized protein n=1 Tax=Brachionus calyciflorus TaxID=104777 RepID=A0A813MD06_9BILA|nr:unnamed protein product [Brachionus calyciflorus]
MMLILTNRHFLQNMFIYLLISANTLFLIYSLNSEDIDSSICNPNLYVKPLCIDQTNTYKCKCNPGFIWNGQMCVSTALNSYFEFEDKSTSGYVFYEKTFPKLKEFTLSTWLQIYNYSSNYAYQNDSRTIFTYSLENSVNIFRCQISSIYKNENYDISKKMSTTFFLKINIYQFECNLKISHHYIKNLFWFHLTLTWSSQNGQIDVYLDGQLKSTCKNIAIKKEIKTAGVFILGQTHSENFFSNLNKKDVIQSTTSSLIKMEPIKNNEFSFDYSNENSLKAEDTELFFVKNLAFVGRITGFNLWNHLQTSEFIQNVYNDCKLAYCGNASQWSDFRQGTRGDVKMKWPTNLLWKRPTCFNESFQKLSCNSYCNREIGPVCRENIENNILWPMSKSNETIRFKCLPKSDNSKYATRHCKYYVKNEYNSDYGGSQTIASWTVPNIDECIQDKLLLLKKQVKDFYTTDNFDENKILSYLETLYDFTVQFIKIDSHNKRSIFDVGTIFDILLYLLDAQQQVITRKLESGIIDGYPNYNDTIKFSEYVLGTIDVILSMSKDSQIWSVSLPIGSESIRIFDLVNKLASSIYDFQKLNFNAHSEDEIEFLDKDFAFNFKNESLQFLIFEIKFNHIVFRQQLLYHEKQMPLNFQFPENRNIIKKNFKQPNTNTSIKNDRKFSKPKKSKHDRAPIKASPNNNKTLSFDINTFQTTIKTSNVSKPIQNQKPSIYHSFINFNEVNLKLPLLNNREKFQYFDPYALLNVYYAGMENLHPNHNTTFRPKDNNLNSVVLTTNLIGSNGFIQIDVSSFNTTFDKPFQIFFNQLINFNISDTRCVYLHATKQKTKIYKWSRQECVLKENSIEQVICECKSFGAYSITNDLYDPNWSPPIVENVPLSIISYIGCMIVCLISIATHASLTYLKAKSTTTSVHKNLCISICLSQLLIMISLSNSIFDRRFCQALSLFNHYIFITVFAWLMNEAFNLYITITYAAHQSTPLSESSSLWKFYLLGWLIPAIIVIIMILAKSDDYYHEKLCWFNLDNIWINISPNICMLSVTFLVMIFSAKEHTEISYTKNEKANKLIANHTKAVWTQIVLLSLCWSFGLMSFMVIEPALKYLFAFFNCLQASFLFIFYFLLNEEVRKYFRGKKKLKRLKVKDKNGQMTNINDLIMETISKTKQENEDDDEDEDEEDEDDEINNQPDGIKESINKLFINNENYSTFTNSFNNAGILEVNNSSIKSVKFERPTMLQPITELNQSKALNSEVKYDIYKNTVAENCIGKKYTNDENKEIIWPQFKKKLSFKKPFTKDRSEYFCDDSGADCYESNQEKVTVL